MHEPCCLYLYNRELRLVSQQDPQKKTIRRLLTKGAISENNRCKIMSTPFLQNTLNNALIRTHYTYASPIFDLLGFGY